MRILTAAVFGIIFGAGLVISGMTDPNRIFAFLDIAGNWDPSLALVMAGAIAVGAPAFALARRKPVAALGDTTALPPRHPVDFNLIAGAALFGAGWGLSGICPGPAAVLLSTAQLKAGIFFGAVLGGIWLAAALTPKSRERKSNPVQPQTQENHGRRASAPLLKFRIRTGLGRFISRGARHVRDTRTAGGD